MATEPATTPSSRTLRVGLPLTLILLAAAGAIAYLGVTSRDRQGAVRSSPLPDGRGSSDGRGSPVGPVVSMTLPFDEPALPPGPHRRDFQIACSTCHSTRLVMTQPPFPKAKWAELVHKMVATYGAPISATEEAPVVDYLAAVHGK